MRTGQCSKQQYHPCWTQRIEGKERIFQAIHLRGICSIRFYYASPEGFSSPDPVQGKLSRWIQKGRTSVAIRLFQRNPTGWVELTEIDKYRLFRWTSSVENREPSAILVPIALYVSQVLPTSINQRRGGHYLDKGKTRHPEVLHFGMKMCILFTTLSTSAWTSDMNDFSLRLWRGSYTRPWKMNWFML